VPAVGKRKCPLCFVRVPWTAALAHSYEMRCPACHAPLELSRFTRVVGALGGLAGAAVAVEALPGIHPGSLWMTRIVAAVLVFGVASAAGVLLAGDLVVRTKGHPATFPHSAK